MHYFACLNIKVPRNYQNRCGHLKEIGHPTTSNGILSNAAHLTRMGTGIVTTEKVEIILRSNDPRLLNSRSDIMAKGRHKGNFSL